MLFKSLRILSIFCLFLLFGISCLAQNNQPATQTKDDKKQAEKAKKEKAKLEEKQKKQVEKELLERPAQITINVSAERVRSIAVPVSF